MVHARILLNDLLERIKLLSDENALEVLRYILEKLSSRIISFEDQIVYIRQALSFIYERTGSYSEAAEVLIGIPLFNGQKEYSIDFKTEVYLRISQLYLLNKDKDKAEGYINRASMLQSEIKDNTLKIKYKLAYANFLDYKSKYLEAAQRYIEASHSYTLSEEQRNEALNNAILSTILAGAGKKRSRFLSTLYKDERCQHSPLFQMLEKMYLEKIIKKSDIQLFYTLMKDHQRASQMDDDTSQVDKAIIEHNLLSVSKIYKSISFEQLSALLQVDEYKVEKYASKMIFEDRMNGQIDQIARIIIFEKSSKLFTFDKQIQTICFHVNDLVDSIVQKYPNYNEKKMDTV